MGLLLSGNRKREMEMAGSTPLSLSCKGKEKNGVIVGRARRLRQALFFFLIDLYWSIIASQYCETSVFYFPQREK